jgi:general secretion pathway protein D
VVPVVEPSAADAAALNQPKVSLNIRNVTLLQAIKYLTEVTGLKYRIDIDAVKIVSQIDAVSTGSLQSRSYTVKPTLFKTVVERTDTGGASASRGSSGGFTGLSGATSVKSEIDARKFLEEFGIDFKGGGNAKYIENLGLLIVTQTTEVLDQIDEIMLKLNKTAAQVTIEAKFIDVRQSDLEQLGFEWSFAPSTQNQYTVESGRGTALPGIPIGGPYRGLGNPMTTGLRQTVGASALDALLSGAVSAVGGNAILSITGVLTNPQVQVIIDALSQKGLTNLLSAPRVTTVSGDSAKIMVTREFIYPSTYSDPQVQTGTASSTSGGSGGVGITAPSPSGWTTREIGVILDVKPNVNPDDNLTINLTLSPEVVDFEGFINYNTYAVANSTQFTFTIPQPIFNKRQITTSVIIWDGQTVVLGGLIREDNVKTIDKIPFLGDIPLLGRFFQSKTDSSTKRNLIIFLSARIVDPSGKPVREFTDARVTAPVTQETP